MENSTPAAPANHNDQLVAAMNQLLRQWKRQVGLRMGNAKFEKTTFGRRFIEHGAICIFNCAEDLRLALEQSMAGKAANNLAAQVLQQDAERP